MINISIEKINQNIVTIEAKGHSGYADAGSDIICSAVSTLLQSLANGLTEVVEISSEIIIDEDEPHLYIHLQDSDDVKMSKAQILMQTTYISLKDLADSYAKYIKLKEKQND
ncbi:MAG: ribosomal-processing cysteine protease Prp [Clostridiales bacterium]|nr:ribosomal-processing cysteine protease Prp [Clostridiales bacterium]